ncbi:Bacterial leucyl aminopeptidase precursor [Roseimaritima multifibrata]|uniref:Bacterial leucyl aminopeptidase n=1 Tax=Roseimaritima multifibrata TaxID=1930274 RepID=A0A517MIR6_9BACT|nr:M36 family metallopeptidase [Roseimaritima multifibrata]QDS94738.1 Bacterial leucyl aminopeptidase precursor [Roseimaritima multifibrata]
MTDQIVFFDLGDTLGSPKLSPPPNVSLVGFDLYDYSIPVLRSLENRSNVKLGIISNTGDDTKRVLDPILTGVGILPFFQDGLILYSGDGNPRKDSPIAFENAATLAGHAKSADRCVFVGEDASERLHATNAFGTAAPGMKVCPHPLLIGEVLDGQDLHFVSVNIPGTEQVASALKVLRTLPFVPMKVFGANARIIGITSMRVAVQLVDMSFGLEFLGEANAPNSSDLFLLKDDKANASGFLKSEGQAAVFAKDSESSRALVGTDSSGLLVQIPGNQSVEEFHFDVAAHGHNLKLVASPSILRVIPSVPAESVATFDSRGIALSNAELQALSKISKEDIRKRVERYSGLTVSPPNPKIHSRHIHHADNAIAVSLMAQEFGSLGAGELKVSLQPFTHEGRSLHNIIAELPGSKSDAGIVLVTAHLDSTAASSSPFVPSSDMAPGADDDASGVAAVLAIAENLIELSSASSFERTIRFVLFNAEEHGLVGSQAYARMLASSSPVADIAAVLQMDMIGYNVRPPRSWEVHAGFSVSDAVEQKSIVLAKIVQDLTPIVSQTLQKPQLYQTTGSPPSVQLDPAEGRSDHASFHNHGYAACVVSEDFFPGPDPSSPSPEANPHYHKVGDQFVDYEYAADIARVIAATTVVVARGTNQAPSPTPNPAPFQSYSNHMETPMPVEIDIRESALKQAAGLRDNESPAIQVRLDNEAMPEAFGGSAPQVAGTINPLTRTPRKLSVSSFQAQSSSSDDKKIEQAMTAMQSLSRGFTGGSYVPQYYPDTFVPKTAAGTSVVSLHQVYRGVPVFQMTETVRFSSSRGLEKVGDTVMLDAVETSVAPEVAADEAVKTAIDHLANSLNGQPGHSHWESPHSHPESSSIQFSLDTSQVAPKVIAVFAMPSRPTVLRSQPFDDPIAANLVWFYAGDEQNGKKKLYLGWFFDITLPGAIAQYHVIVGASESQSGNILFATEASKSAQGPQTVSGNVYETNPGDDANVDSRRTVPFPRPIADYPLPPPVIPIPPNFPMPWIVGDESEGHATDGKVVVQEFPRSEERVKGQRNENHLTFNPISRDGEDQQALNEFYFCNYMHDFFYVLGFREGDGNFSGNDRVEAFSHPRPVFGTANMLTRVEGLSPTMNMGLVASTGRHTAFDADVVFHEFLHGVSNRLVGGGNNVNALNMPQSGMQGEGWGDYFALTIQNFGQATERTTTGDWVTNSSGQGIRRFPYTDGYPEDFGNIRPGGTTQVHAGGEIWCATLMHMTRLMGRELNDQNRAYYIAWQIVVDAFKLSPTNPSFLDSRDAIFDALDDLNNAGAVTSPERNACRRAIWTAFAGFGMGPGASSLGASIHGVITDFQVPSEPAIGLNGNVINRPRDTSLQANPGADAWNAAKAANPSVGHQQLLQKLSALPRDQSNAIVTIIDAYLNSQNQKGGA